MARCNSCNKFVSFDEQGPEVQSLEVDDGGFITCEVRIVNACAECGEELMEATFQMEEQLNLPGTEDHTHDLTIEEAGADRTQPDHTPPRKDGKPVPYRYRKTWYGVEISATVSCSGCDYEEDVVLTDDIQASTMDALS